MYMSLLTGKMSWSSWRSPCSEGFNCSIYGSGGFGKTDCKSFKKQKASITADT